MPWTALRLALAASAALRAGGQNRNATKTAENTHSNSEPKTDNNWPMRRYSCPEIHVVNSDDNDSFHTCLDEDEYAASRKDFHYIVNNKEREISLSCFQSTRPVTNDSFQISLNSNDGCTNRSSDNFTGERTSANHFITQKNIVESDDIRIKIENEPTVKIDISMLSNDILFDNKTTSAETAIVDIKNQYNARQIKDSSVKWHDFETKIVNEKRTKFGSTSASSLSDNTLSPEKPTTPHATSMSSSNYFTESPKGQNRRRATSISCPKDTEERPKERNKPRTTSKVSFNNSTVRVAEQITPATSASSLNDSTGTHIAQTRPRTTSAPSCSDSTGRPKEQTRARTTSAPSDSDYVIRAKGKERTRPQTTSANSDSDCVVRSKGKERTRPRTTSAPSCSDCAGLHQERTRPRTTSEPNCSDSQGRPQERTRPRTTSSSSCHDSTGQSKRVRKKSECTAPFDEFKVREQILKDLRRQRTSIKKKKKELAKLKKKYAKQGGRKSLLTALFFAKKINQKIKL